MLMSFSQLKVKRNKMCNGPYCDVCGESHWYNFFVPDDVWEQIAPLDYVPGGGGILCVRCIDKRCVKLGIKTTGRFYFTGEAVTALTFDG